MNLVIVSNHEDISFHTICSCVFTMPKNVNWKILGNSQHHQRLISVLGREKFIDIPILQLHEHIYDKTLSPDFLANIPAQSIIVPTDFESLRFLAKNKDSFPGHTVCPLMDDDLLDYFDNKSNQKEITAKCNVLSPKEYTYSQLENIPENQRLVIKPNLGAGSSGVFISQNRQEAVDYYESLSLENKKDHVIQDYIEGNDYFYYAICHNGKICISGTIKPGRFKHLGTTFVSNPLFDENAEKIVRHYRYSGPISIDFRMSQDSKSIYLIEINPRNGSNCYFFNAANVNWLLELAKISVNPNVYQSTYNITVNKWLGYWKIALLYIFFKLRIYNIKILAKFLMSFCFSAY